jgi:diketogulonate reductase-like aldo/keto reductase
MVCHVPTGDDWYLSQSQIDLASSNDGNSLDSKRSAQQRSPHPAGRSWRLPRGQGAETRDAVRHALHVGYWHIDTARIYGNEEDVGAAVRESGLSRSAIFVTTKLWNADQGTRSAAAAFEASLARLGIDYVDLYLLHWPVPGKRLESWRELEWLRQPRQARL